MMRIDWSSRIAVPHFDVKPRSHYEPEEKIDKSSLRMAGRYQRQGLGGQSAGEPPLVLRFRGCASCGGARGAAAAKRPEFMVMFSKMGPTIFETGRLANQSPQRRGGECKPL